MTRHFNPITKTKKKKGFKQHVHYCKRCKKLLTSTGSHGKICADCNLNKDRDYKNFLEKYFARGNKRCQYILKNGNQCKKAAVIHGGCYHHYEKLLEMNDDTI